MRWEQHLDQQLMCAAQSFDTFAEDDLTAEEFVDLEVALGDAPTAEPVAGVPLEHSQDAVAVADRVPLFTEYDRSTHLRFLRKLCLYFVCCPCALAFLLRRCLPPCLKRCWELMKDVVYYVCCVPLERFCVALCRCCDAVGRCCTALGRAIHKCCAAAHRIFVAPIVKVIRKCCIGMAHALRRCYAAVKAAVGVCCRAIHRVVVKPLVACCAAIYRQIARGCNAVASAVGKCCTCICRSIGKCCNWVGEHVVTPLRNCVLAVMYGIYDHIMAPLGRGIYAVAAAMYAVAARVAAAIYAVAARVGNAMYSVAAEVAKSIYDVAAGVAAAMYDVAAAVANAAYGVAEALGNAINGTGRRP